MISRTQTDESLARLGMLKYFPTRDAVVVEVARLLNEICQNDQEARALTAAVCAQCSEWPGPGKLHELHKSVIASSRPRASEPVGCGLCMDGYRTVFQIFEGRGSGGKVEHIHPEGSISDVMRQWKELLVRYAGPKTHTCYQTVTPCTCELGRRRGQAKP